MQKFRAVTVHCTVSEWLTQLNDIATIKTLPLTTSSTKFVLRTFFVYPHALVKNVVAPISATRGSQAYKELMGVEDEEDVVS